MRFEGTLSSRNDERGYGRIESSQGGEPIFFHVSAWPRGAGCPQQGQAVYFEVELGPKGKRAKIVQVI
jgi:cold shock CspA family protein